MAIEKKIGRPIISEEVWDMFVADGFVDGVIEGDYLFKDLVDDYLAIEKYVKAGVKIGANIYEAERILLPKSGFPKEKGADISIREEDIAFSKAVAYKVAQIPHIKKFRREVLKGKLLQPEEMEAWIEEKRKQDGTPTRFLKIRAKDIAVSIDEKSWWPLKITPVFDEEDVIGVEHVYLFYPSRNGGLKQVPINVDGILGRLKAVAVDIVTYHCTVWKEAEAVAFILTGRVPFLPKVRYKISFSSNGTPCWVTLNLDARTTPQELAKEYTKIRRRVMGSYHHKPLSGKNLKLAEFTAERKEGLTWGQLMKKWNEEYPQWEYKNYRLFCRDAIGSINRLLEGKIDYASLFRESGS
ncbi:MAG: hypothetical protein ACPLTR_08065 [Thermacetogeniaceae bacterium]